MVVDGIEPETIRDIMELEIDEMEKDINQEQTCLNLGRIFTSIWYDRYINRTYTNACKSYRL